MICWKSKKTTTKETKGNSMEMGEKQCLSNTLTNTTTINQYKYIIINGIYLYHVQTITLFCFLPTQTTQFSFSDAETYTVAAFTIWFSHRIPTTLPLPTCVKTTGNPFDSDSLFSSSVPLTRTFPPAANATVLTGPSTFV